MERKRVKLFEYIIEKNARSSIDTQADVVRSMTNWIVVLEETSGAYTVVCRKKTDSLPIMKFPLSQRRSTSLT